MLPNRTGTPLALLELTWKPAPGVEKTTPRGVVVLKKSGGNWFGAENWSGVPSQLISRRPVSNVVAWFGLSPPPRSARNWFTTSEMAAGPAPAADRTVGAAEAGTASASAKRAATALTTSARSRLEFPTCILPPLSSTSRVDPIHGPRSNLRRMSPPRRDVRIIGSSLGAEDQRLRDFMTRAAQPFEWYEAGTPAANELLAAQGISPADLPVVLDGGEALAPATIDAVVEAWGISAPPERSDYDLAIIGSGPAGLAAAVYAASDGLSTVALEADLPGGQASYTSLIENFFGFPDGIGGAELARMAGRQAEKFGARLVIRRGVVGHRVLPEGRFEIALSGGASVRAPLVIAAPGMDWRRLDVDGIDALLGGGGV